MEYLSKFWSEVTNFASWTWRSIVDPTNTTWWFWAFVGVTTVAVALEWTFPWRKKQGVMRRDVGLDAFYLMFNGVIFPLMGWIAAVNVVGMIYVDVFGDTQFIGIAAWPWWARALTFFVLRDFVQWNIHRLLHRVPWLWEFHKVHHSAKDMGVTAQLRFHWMENVVYRTLESIPFAMIGFGTQDFVLVHVFALTVGHLNHANLYLPIGPLRYVLNTPQMHIWHHAKHLPEERRYGVNFGLTLSLWDWLFGTVYWPGQPEDGRDEELGFAGDEAFPRDFVGQATWPLSRRKAT